MRTINQPSTQQVSIATTTTTNNNTVLQRRQKPKIPPTAFQLYCNDFISSSTQLQTFNSHSVTHQLNLQWNTMSDVVKQPYINYRTILQKQYEEALKQYELYNMQNPVNNNIWGNGSRAKSASVPQSNMQKQRIQVFGSNINIKQTTFTLYDATLQQKLQNAKGRGLGLSLLSINRINKTTQSITSPPNNNMVDLTVDTENEQQISSTESRRVHQKAQGEEKKDQNGDERDNGEDIDVIQQPSTSYQEQQQAPDVKNNLSQKVQNDSINTPVRLKRKRDEQPDIDDTVEHPEKDFHKWLSIRKDDWARERQKKQKDKIQSRSREMTNSEAKDKSDEVSPKKQTLRSNFGIGCPVWFNMHYLKPCSNHLIADSGIVKSVIFNNKTQQLDHAVVSNIDSSVLTLTKEDLAFAVHCPVLTNTDENYIDGQIINVKPTESTVNKATFTYTVMTSNEGRCMIEEGVTDDRLRYKLSLPSLQSKIKDIVPRRYTKFGIRTGSDGRPKLNKAPLVLQFKDRSQKVSTNIDNKSDDQDDSYSSNDEEERERESSTKSSTDDDDSFDEHEKKHIVSASSSLPKTKKKRKLEKTKQRAATIGHDTRHSVKVKSNCNSSNRRSRSAMVGSTCKEDPLTYVGNYISNRLVADEGWHDKVEKIDLINFGQVIYKTGHTKKTSKEGETKFTGYAALARYAYRAGIYEKVVDTIHGREILAKLGITEKLLGGSLVFAVFVVQYYY